MLRKAQGKKDHHSCEPVASIYERPELCYYHEKKHYYYWEVTKSHPDVFIKETLVSHTECPFKFGQNQLWRNLLLALKIEDVKPKICPAKNVYFSVVHHPDNHYLDNDIAKFQKLIGNNYRFSAFDSRKLIEATVATEDCELLEWVRWYRELYRV